MSLASLGFEGMAFVARKLRGTLEDQILASTPSGTRRCETKTANRTEPILQAKPPHFCTPATPNQPIPSAPSPHPPGPNQRLDAATLATDLQFFSAHGRDARELAGLVEVAERQLKEPLQLFGGFSGETTGRASILGDPQLTDTHTK